MESKWKRSKALRKKDIRLRKRIRRQKYLGHLSAGQQTSEPCICFLLIVIRLLNSSCSK